jgi:hypothetical protein
VPYPSPCETWLSPQCHVPHPAQAPPRAPASIPSLLPTPAPAPFLSPSRCCCDGAGVNVSAGAGAGALRQCYNPVVTLIHFLTSLSLPIPFRLTQNLFLMEPDKPDKFLTMCIPNHLPTLLPSFPSIILQFSLPLIVPPLVTKSSLLCFISFYPARSLTIYIQPWPFSNELRF